MEQSEVNESISVLASFKGGQPTPLFFKRDGRKIRLESIDLKYDYQIGDVRIYAFSTSSHGNTYKITFNNKTLIWMLEEVFIK